MTETYPKKYNSPDDLVALLIQRGLTITDESIASQYIRNIGYYRLSAYLYPLLDIPKEKQIREKYSNPYPPAWMLVEILPLGVVTRIYDNLADNALRKKIAARFLLPVPVFSSWITITTLVRNTCCHHSRVWNKENAITPMLLKKPLCRWISKERSLNRAFYDICILKWFVNVISPENDMKRHLKKLLSDFPSVDVTAMGFPKNWEEEPLWCSAPRE